MAHRLSQNARHTNELLEELERDKELDVLRRYLIRFDLFPRKRDPATAPIRFEELKELVKHWRLHRQRNFWKNHTTKEDLVRTLYRHINTKIILQESAVEDTTNAMSNGPSNVPNVVAPSSPTVPAIRAPSSAGMESPRTKSLISNTRRSLANVASAGRQGQSKRKEKLLSKYRGDLFGQRGNYEDGMIYLSRFHKLGGPQDFEETDSEDGSQDQRLEEDEVQFHESTKQTTESTNGLSREVRLKQECAYTIYHFSTEPGNERQMIQEGSIPAISRLTIFDDMEVKRFCAASIHNLTCETSLCQKMIEEGVLLALLELAKAQNEEIRRNTSIALCRISYERSGQLRLVQEGCVSAIISMLNSPDYVTKEACVKSLINIASHSGTAIAESVVQTIVKMSIKKEYNSLAFAAEAIRNLSLLMIPRAKVVEDGILDNICDLAQSALDVGVKINLATALCNFSGLQSNLEMISQVRILECIEDLLKFDNDIVREMCAITIANISSFAPSLKNLVLSDAVVQLVEMGHKPNPIIQENTALALSNMSITSDTRPLLARFGVVTLLLHFLEESSLLTKQYAIIALCSLMVNPSMSTELVQSNIPAVLSKLSTSSNEKVKDLCAHALFNLSCDKSLHSFLLKEEVIQAIVHLCKNVVTTQGTTVVVDNDTNSNNGSPDKVLVRLLQSQEFAIGAIYNMSFFEDSRKVLIRTTDLVKILFQIFNGTIKNEELTKQCAAIIANLTFDVENRTRMVDDGSVRLIRKLMSCSHKDTLVCCSTALCNIAAEALERTSVLSMLIELSKSSHPAIILNCAIAFSKLASNSSYRSILTKTPELYPALTVMMRCGIEDIQTYSAVALCNLAMEKGNTRSKHIWKEGTVPDFIVNALLRINSDSTKEICARALYNLLTHDEYRMSYIKEGVLYALVKLARLESVEIRSLCVTALYNLSCDPLMIDILMDINVAQVITKMCEMEFSNQEIHRRLAACLTNVAMKPGTETKLVEGGALMAVQVLSEHNDPLTIHSCASILSYLSSQRSNCEAMASSNLVNVLAKVISSDDNQQNLFGLNAICNISLIPSLHDRIEESGAITHVIRLLSVNDDETIQDTCMKILCNLTYHQKYRKVMCKNDLIEVLHKVFTYFTISFKVVEVASRIIALLCEDLNDAAELIAKGAIKVLTVLARHAQSATARLECIYSLSQLCRLEEKGLQVLQDGAMEILAAIIPLAYNEQTGPKIPTEIAERSAILLRTLSTYANCLPFLTEDVRLVPIIRSITFDKNRETCRHGVITLYNITATKSHALEKMVQSGGIKLLIFLSSIGGTEISQACAITLAHIKHINKDTNKDGAGKSDKMEGGVVATLISMIDMDQGSIQKIDRMAATLPANLPPTKPIEWVFLPGDITIRPGRQSAVSWSFRSSAIDEAKFAAAEPKSHLMMLSPSVPEIGMAVQDRLYGQFEILRVNPEKYIIKLIDTSILRRGSSVQNALNAQTLEALLPSPRDDRQESSAHSNNLVGLPGTISNELAEKEHDRNPDKNNGEMKSNSKVSAPRPTNTTKGLDANTPIQHKGASGRRGSRTNMSNLGERAFYSGRRYSCRPSSTPIDSTSLTALLSSPTKEKNTSTQLPTL
jgi:hypothetical protein